MVVVAGGGSRNCRDSKQCDTMGVFLESGACVHGGVKRLILAVRRNCCCCVRSRTVKINK